MRVAKLLLPGVLTAKQALLVTGCSAAHYWKCGEIMWDLRSECIK